MGYQRSTFPLFVYGCIDTASRKVISLRICTNTCDPKRVVGWYFDYLFEKRIVLARLRIDKVSETGVTATMHTILRSGHCKLEDLSESVMFGKSAANQIERWWRELHDCFEKYFKEQLMHILQQGHYDPQKEIYRSIIAFVYIPALEREMHFFVTNCNNHQIRFQKDTILPDGAPEHIYSFPEKYSFEKCGLSISEEQLQQLVELSRVQRISNEYLENDFKNRCAELVE